MNNVLPKAIRCQGKNIALLCISLLTSTAIGSTLISIMNVLPINRKVQVLNALIEGCGINATVRMTGTHKTTILRLLRETGDRCMALLDDNMRNLTCQHLQVDELWTFVKKKQRVLTKEEKRNLEIGDQYVFLAICADTKIIPTFRIGKRDGSTATAFILDLQSRLSSRIQLTSDAFLPYEWAVESAFGADVDFATLTKIYRSNGAGRGRYAPPEIQEVISRVVNGSPDPNKVSTSYVERVNLSLRMEQRRFTRLTNGFSKSFDNLRAAVTLWVAWYNFGRIHGSLRVTPAMEAGITDHIWIMEELITYDET